MEEAKTPFREGDPIIAYIGGDEKVYKKMMNELMEVTQLRAFFTIGAQGITQAMRKVVNGQYQAGLAMGSWEIPEDLLNFQKKNRFSDEEMFEQFPMGISAMAIVSGWDAERACDAAAHAGIEGYVVGELLRKQIDSPELILI